MMCWLILLGILGVGIVLCLPGDLVLGKVFPAYWHRLQQFMEDEEKLRRWSAEQYEAAQEFLAWLKKY